MNKLTFSGRWTPALGNKMPDEGNDVLVVQADGSVVTAFVRDGTFRFSETGCMFDCDIRYWTNFPRPPQCRKDNRLK